MLFLKFDTACGDSNLTRQPATNKSLYRYMIMAGNSKDIAMQHIYLLTVKIYGQVSKSLFSVA